MAEKHLTRPKAVRVFKAAKQHHFINDGINVFGAEPVRLSVTHKEGLSFIQKRLGIPTGLFRAILDENKTLIVTITAIIIAVCTVINLWITVRPH